MKTLVIFGFLAILLLKVATAQEQCVVCSMVVNMAESYMSSSNMTAPEVENALANDCLKLSNKIAVAECTGFVHQYLSVIIDQLANVPLLWL